MASEKLSAEALPAPMPAKPQSSGLSVSVELIPDEVDLALKQAAEALPEARRPVWHRVETLPHSRVVVQSEDDLLRRVRLSVRSRTAGWKASWVRWSYAVRRTPQDLGGDALAAQDELAPDDRTLTLLLLPGERRAATLEFDAVLDGETAPGDYPFEVVLTDIETGAETAPMAGLLRLRHPTANLLASLPALYVQEPGGPGQGFAPYEDPPFFERFLRGFEDAQEPLREMLSGLYRYFDADSAPADFLPWLATWVALDLDEHWLQLKRRRLIKEAIWLYRWRGTRKGLSRYLEIYSGVKPEINDQPFSGMRLGVETLLGRDTILGGVGAHTFVVTLAVPDPSAVSEETLRLIIESQKPAHTAYDLRIVEREAGPAALELEELEEESQEESEGPEPVPAAA